MAGRGNARPGERRDGAHIAKTFTSDDGNIWLERFEHTWNGDICKHCGSARSVFDRREALESHSYAFSHTDNINTRLAQNRKSLEMLGLCA